MTFAAGVSGKWNGTFAGNRPDGSTDEPRPAFMELKQDGAKVTGKIGPTAEEAVAINNGLVKDDVLTFNAQPSSRRT